MTAPETNSMRARDLVSVVLVEAFGSSMTPFVPVPFVDDYLFARLLRRIARKVIEKNGGPADDTLAKAITAGYTDAGKSPLGTQALAAAARFIVRKVAIVLDVKKSHDVFGEAIAYALAVDVAMELGAVNAMRANALGAAIYRSTQSVGSAALEVMTRAAREAFSAASASPSPDASAAGGVVDGRYARVTAAIGKQVDEARMHLSHVLRYELTRP